MIASKNPQKIIAKEGFAIDQWMYIYRSLASVKTRRKRRNIIARTVQYWGDRSNFPRLKLNVLVRNFKGFMIFNHIIYLFPKALLQKLGLNLAELRIRYQSPHMQDWEE